MQKKGGFIKNQFLIQPSNKNKVLFKSFNDKVEKESVREAQMIEKEYNRVLNNLEDKSNHTNTEPNNETHITQNNEDVSERWKKILLQSNQANNQSNPSNHSPTKKRKETGGVVHTLEDENSNSNKGKDSKHNKNAMLKKEDFADASQIYEFVSPEAGNFINLIKINLKIPSQVISSSYKSHIRLFLFSLFQTRKFTEFVYQTLK